MGGLGARSEQLSKLSVWETLQSQAWEREVDTRINIICTVISFHSANGAVLPASCIICWLTGKTSYKKNEKCCDQR